ncbi:YqiA/YcfP family alpha/beta fold hydrolase [Paraglaciecola hydrolytica]|uniref:Esterase YqiA n=1 Tax=Paraglaciecola hydrolytica TaxID=1799789 RepID=A0A136A4X4_9ALTE|nr:YqiA/YcfP family alpha/beta fold hydrolase [Paraglaciecola hydrolytica]KXI30264.1 esterase YqiA [Paraglaciecola hydrolytica]
MEKVVIYLHGFLSSPQSLKAQQTLAFVNTHYPNLTLEIPNLANYPAEAHTIIETVIKEHADKQCCFIGSSMGGYFSTYMQQKFGGKAVLINPAVKPYELLVDYLGEHVNPYTQQHFTLQHSHIDELIGLDVPLVKCCENIWVLLQTGDETLDYRQAEYKYQGAKMTIEQGGDHSFQDFERFLPEIFRFLLQD